MIEHHVRISFMYDRFDYTLYWYRRSGGVESCTRFTLPRRNVLERNEGYDFDSITRNFVFSIVLGTSYNNMTWSSLRFTQNLSLDLFSKRSESQTTSFLDFELHNRTHTKISIEIRGQVLEITVFLNNDCQRFCVR